MAIFRKVHTSFWSDTFISDLDRDRKLFYLYLITNERTKQCGIYEISKRQIAFDLCVNVDTVSKQLAYFIEQNKIMYNDLTKELAIKNWNKYNSSSSPKVQSCINKELQHVKDTVLIEYIKGIYTASQEEQEEEQEEEQDSETELLVFSFDEFWELQPNKVAKQKCKEKYEKLSVKDREAIYNTLQNWVKYKPFQGYSHPNPETYLNQKRWEDEIPTEPKNKKSVADLQYESMMKQINQHGHDTT